MLDLFLLLSAPFDGKIVVDAMSGRLSVIWIEHLKYTHWSWLILSIELSFLFPIKTNMADPFSGLPSFIWISNVKYFYCVWFILVIIRTIISKQLGSMRSPGFLMLSEFKIWNIFKCSLFILAIVLTVLHPMKTIIVDAFSGFLYSYYSMRFLF